MPDPGDERRDRLHAFMQEQGPPDEEHHGALLTGWVVVQSWVTADGEPRLSLGWSAETTQWAANGMLYEALYGDWPTSEA